MELFQDLSFSLLNAPVLRIPHSWPHWKLRVSLICLKSHQTQTVQPQEAATAWFLANATARHWRSCAMKWSGPHHQQAVVELKLRNPAVSDKKEHIASRAETEGWTSSRTVNKKSLVRQSAGYQPYWWRKWGREGQVSSQWPLGREAERNCEKKILLENVPWLKLHLSGARRQENRQI